MKNKKYLFLSFVVPVGLFILLAFCLHVFPFGDRTFLISDLEGQYNSLFSHFKDIVSGSSSFFYSFSKGLGGNMVGTFAYYLSSPLNLLFAFFDKAHLAEGIFALLTLKIGLSGLCMYLFLNNKKNKNSFHAFLFSLCYALMAYSLNYYFNIIWLDGVFLAPLVFLGIDRIFAGKRSWFYALFLFLAILSNFYIGFMIAIAAVLYFIYRLITTYEWKKDFDEILKKAISFGVASLLAGIATSFLLLPTLMDLQNSSKAFGNLTTSAPYWQINPFDYLSKTVIGSHNYQNILNTNTVHLFCGTMTLPLLVFSFFSKKWSKKEKIMNACLLGCFLLSFAIPYLNMIWHGFNYPIGFNYRYSFLFCLFALMIAYQTLNKGLSLPKKAYFIYWVVYAILLGITYTFQYIYLSLPLILTTLGCLAIYLMIFYLKAQKLELERQKILSFLFSFILIGELFFNGYMSLRQYEIGYHKEYLGYQEIVGKEIDTLKPKENEFYRLEKNFYYTLTDPMLLGYPGVSTFLSTINQNSVNFFRNTGFVSRGNDALYGSGTTPVIDSILGIKYVLLQNEKNEYYQPVTSFPFSLYGDFLYDMRKRDVNIYENQNALSLGYLVSDRVNQFSKEFIENKKFNQFEYQNLLLKTMVDGKEDFLVPYSVQKIPGKKTEYEITLNGKKTYYMALAFKSKPLFSYRIYLNDELIKVQDIDRYGIFQVENKTPNQKITLRLESDNASLVADPFLYYLEDSVYQKAMDQLKGGQWQIEEFKETNIKATIKVTDSNQILFTSIPYEKGWSAFVDGEKLPISTVFDTFIGLDLEKGTHTVELKFQAPGWNIGLFLSIGALLASFIYFIKEKQWLNFIVKIYHKEEEIILYLIGGGLTTVVSLGSYLLFARLFHINYMISSILSWILAVIFAYVVNKVLVFKSKTTDQKAAFKELVSFFQVRIATLVIDLGVMYLLVDLMHTNDIFAKVVDQVIIVIINYILSKLFVFSSKKKNKD